MIETMEVAIGDLPEPDPATVNQVVDQLEEMLG